MTGNHGPTDPAPSPEQAPAWCERMGELLAASHLLTALVDEHGAFLFRNAALREHTDAGDPPAESLPALFTPWSRDKLESAALPTAQRWGLWEGPLTLDGARHPLPVHATLVGGAGADPVAQGTVLALLMPHSHGSHGNGAEGGTDTADLSGQLAIPLHQETRLLHPASITHLEAHGAYTQVFLPHKALLTSLRLSWFEDSLPDSFVRTHRGYLVNMQRVESLVRHDGHLFLRLDAPAAPEVPVSRRREAHIRDILDTAQQVRGSGE
jgi:hypothetical protein